VFKGPKFVSCSRSPKYGLPGYETDHSECNLRGFTQSLEQVLQRYLKIGRTASFNVIPTSSFRIISQLDAVKLK